MSGHQNAPDSRAYMGRLQNAPRPTMNDDGYTGITAYSTLTGAKGIKCGECGMYRLASDKDVAAVLS